MADWEGRASARPWTRRSASRYRLERFSKYCSHLARDFRRCGFQPRKQLGRDRMSHLRTLRPHLFVNRSILFRKPFSRTMRPIPAAPCERIWMMDCSRLPKEGYDIGIGLIESDASGLFAPRIRSVQTPKTHAPDPRRTRLRPHRKRRPPAPSESPQTAGFNPCFSVFSTLPPPLASPAQKKLLRDSSTMSPGSRRMSSSGYFSSFLAFLILR